MDDDDVMDNDPLHRATRGLVPNPLPPLADYVVTETLTGLPEVSFWTWKLAHPNVQVITLRSYKVIRVRCVAPADVLPLLDPVEVERGWVLQWDDPDENLP